MTCRCTITDKNMECTKILGDDLPDSDNETNFPQNNDADADNEKTVVFTAWT